MNFAQISRRLFRYEKAKAKLNEFNVSEDERKNNKLVYTSSIDLIYSTVRVLSEYAEAYIDDMETSELYNDLTFISRFYENFIEAENEQEDYFFLLVGSISNILSDNFGNACSLLKKIKFSQEMNSIAQMVFDYIARGLNIGISTSMISLDNEEHTRILKLLADELKNSIQTENSKELRILAKKNLMIADHESAFFANLLCALHKKYIENSATRLVPLFSDSKYSDWNKYFKQENSIKILWQSQKLLLESNALRGNSATIQLPTGVGKTKSIELIISSAFLLRNVSLSIVVAPLRALCNEIEKDLKKSIKDIVKIADISDVLNDESDFDFTQKQVIVLTPEKLSFLIKHDVSIIQRCGLIIFDEAHMFDDPSRGATYEFLVLHVKDLLQSNSQKIFISAVMPNANELNGWLTDGLGSIITDREIKRTEKSIGFFSEGDNKLLFFEQNELIENGKEIVFIPQICPKEAFVIERYSRRTNKGKIIYKVGDPKIIFPDRSDSADIAIYLACKLCKTGSVAIYVNKQNQVFSIAEKMKELHLKGYKLLNNIMDKTDNDEAMKIFNLAKEHFGDESEFVQILQLGIFPHYGDLENGLRLSIENGIKKQKISFVVCTSTLAEGVNLPIRYLIVTSFKNAFGQVLENRKFQNLFGRTARSGIHTEGSLICSDPKVINARLSNSKEWRNVVSLFNPSNSENCNSLLLQIYEDIEITYKGGLLPGELLVNQFLKNYQNGIKDFNILGLKNRLDEWAKEINHHLRKDVTDIIQNRIILIKTVVETLETVILDKSTKEVTNIDNEEIEQNLAKKTLAYTLANDEQRELIVDLFASITNKVNQIEKDKRIIFSKTMNGIDELNKVDMYLHSNQILYIDCSFNEEIWIDAIVDLTEIFDLTREFYSLERTQKREMIQDWLQGKTYKEIKNRVQSLELTKVIKICQKDLGYKLNLLLSCVIELLQQYIPNEKSNEEWLIFIDKIKVLQQRIKYGLLNEAEIAAYEIGFADRIISRKIGEMLVKKFNYQSVLFYKKNIIKEKDEVNKIVALYPSYFETILL